MHPSKIYRRIRLMHIINARLRNQEGLHELHLEDGLILSLIHI